MSSFNFNRGVNNKVIKKNVNFTTTPKINNNAFTLNNTNLNLSVLKLDGSTVTTSGDQLNYIDDATVGSATANKVVIPDNNLDISNINTITCNSLVVNGNTIIPSNSNVASESNSPYLQKIIPGKIQNSKAIVTDNNRNIETINKLSLNKLNISDNKILTSSNSVIKKKIYPLTWGVNPTTFSNNITSLCWSEELGLAVAVTSTGTGNQVLTSPDGITWTSRTTPVDRNWSSVCWAPEIGKFVAVASSPYIEYGGMTTASSNGLTASSSSNIASWEAWNAFDTSISTGWHSTETTTRYTATTGVYVGGITTTDTNSTIHSGEWIQLQASSAFLLTEFTIRPRQTFGDQRSPRSFVILGSNNGSTWNLLFTETNKNDWPANNGPAVTFNITNPTTSYSYYRMVVKRIGNLDSGMSIATSIQIMNIEYNPEPFFSNVMYSSNGIDWTEVNPNISSNWTSICWSPTLSLFTAVGTTRANRVMTSPDGINWTARTAVNLNAWQSICWSPQLSLFVAVSNTGTGNRVMTSVNGTTWIGRNSSVDNNWSSICWAPNINLFVAVSTSGSSNRIVTSPDSITWTTRLSPIDNNWLSVTYSKELNLLVAVASSGTNRIMFSENGTEWYISSYVSSLNLDSIVWAPSIQKFIVGSSISPTESSILTSQIFNENITLTNPGKSYYNMINGSTKFINKVVGNTFDTAPYCSIWVKELNTFILGGGLGYIMLSSDGNVWTRYFTELTTIIQSITWSPQLNLLVAVSPSTTNNILTSTDGKHWMLRANSTGNSTTWQSVCWSPELSLFVAVGNGTTNQRVITSPDGINWTLRTGVTNTWTAVCWSSELGLFVAIGNTNNTTNIMYSSDGINWTARTSISGTGSSTAFTSICWSPELYLFVAVSSDRVIISKDGINWNYRSVNNNSWQSICWAKGLGLFLAVGISNNDTLMISPDGNNWKTITTTDGGSGCRTICWSEELNTFVASNNNKIVTLNNFQYNEFSINSNHNLTNLSKYNNDNENNLYDTWYNTHSGIDNEWTSICYSTDLALLAAVSKTGNGNRVMTSSNGTTWTARTTPVSNSGSTPILSMNSIEVSGGASFIILNDNTVKAMGDNTSGLLGNGNTTRQDYPISLTGLSNVVKISGGTYFTLFLLSNGTIKAAGRNNKGQLGNSTTTNSSTPVNVLGIDNAIDISCGPEHAFALLSDGTVKAWGIDERRLGIDENYRQFISTPTLIPNITNAISIHATSNGGMALLSNGTIMSWATINTSGQIGDGTLTARYTPVLVANINNAVSLSVGGGHAFAILSDGTIKAWGANQEGKVGDGTNTNRPTPVTLTSLTNVIAIEAGQSTSFAILSDGTIKGWGRNEFGQIGDGTITYYNSPITIPNISNCIAIKTGHHTLALLSDGTLKAWGANHNRQLGNGLTNNTQLTPTTVLTSVIDNNPLSNIKINATISTSDNNWTSICWSSELDLFVAVASSGTGDRVMTSPDGITWTSRSSATDNEWTSVCWSPELNLFAAVASSGSGNRVMTSSDGIIWTSRSSAADNNWTSVCWSPELSLLVAVSNTGSGNRVMTSSNGTTWIIGSSAADNNWTSVCWSYYYGLFVAVASSGSDNRIMTSLDGINWSTSIIYKPNQISTISMNSISACNNTSFAIISDNTMRAWGNNSNTKLGNTGSTSHNLPFLPTNTKVASGYWDNVIKVLANNNITVALLSNGKIQTRGLNTNGDLGIANAMGTNGNSYSAVVDISDITNATDIAIGEMHVLALLSDGSIKAWGTNTNGQLGDGTNTLRETPVTISSLNNVVSISTKNGGYHSLALLSNGTVKSWGLNTNGQLGNNSTTSENSPVTVNNLSNVIAISAGANHSLALLNNGTVMAWGLNTSGQLGDGTTTQRNEPVLVSGVTNVVAISAGYTHSLALLSDGTIKAWGSNNNGQLGDTTNNNSLTAVTVSGITSALAISAGNEYSLALLSNSRLMSWGYNNVGQLGINSTTSRNTPGFVQFDATTTNVLHSIKLNILNTTSYANNDWTSICWSDEMKVFVAIANSGSNRIMISNNGTTWYNKTLSVNNNWTSICWSDLLSRFIGVSTDSTNNILYSNIGINSLLSTVPTITNRQIGFTNNALSIGGTIAQNYLSINADSNNNILRLTNNKSATNCIDFNANGSTTHQLNIINNSSNKIINIVNHNGSTFGLRFNNSVLPVTANDLNKLVSIAGTASASKALITDSSRNITNINNISVNKLIVNNNLILNSSDNNNLYLSSITPGTVSPSKLMVLDSNRNISTLNKITTDNIKINKVNSIEHQLNNNNFDLKNYYFGQTKNSMLNPSNLNMNSVVWSPELSIFVGVGSTWGGASSDKNINNYSINYSYDGINWQTAIGFSIHSDRKLCIAWSSTLLRFVVLSDYQRVGYSLDGKNWVGYIISLTNGWTSLVWADTLNLFVAVGNSGTGNRVMTSPDGITWTSRTSAADNVWTSLAWGNNTLVAVANSGTTNRVMTSTNGTSWTIRTTPNSNDWNAVTYGNGLFVAVSSTGTGNRVMTSPDGTTWTARTSVADNTWQSIIYANNLFIAGSNSGTNNRIMTSSDGITWTTQNTTNLNIDFKCFAYSPSLNIIVAGSNGNGLNNVYASNKIATSTNGTSWTLKDSTYDLTWDVIYVNELSLFIGVSSRGGSAYTKQLAYSSDGYIWNYGYIDNTIAPSFQKVCWSATLSLLIAISNSNKFYKSIDGINWTSITVPHSTIWNCIIWINELSMFIAVGSSGRVVKSSDGNTWSSITMPSSTNNTYVEWSSSLNLAIITTQSSPTIYFTSSDGDNWTQRTMLADGVNNINTNMSSVITWISQLNLFMYFGISNVYTYYTSTDGLNWTTRSTQVTTSRSANLGLINVTRPPVWINKFNKLYGIHAGDNFSRIFESSDGITWNKYYIINSLHDKYSNLCWANQIETLVAYGPNTYLTPVQPFMTLNTYNTPNINHNLSTINNLVNSYSSSASIESISTWISRTSATNNNWTSICYSFDKNLFIAVSNTGSGNRVMTSSDAITWTSRTSAVNNNWTSICYSQDLGLFVAVANSGTGNRVMTSSDGTTWTSRTSAADNNWTSICWSADLGLFVAVANSGTSNRIMTSSNGTNWELRSNPVDNNWTSICWSPDLEIFVAVASSGTGDRVMTSYNGITWTSRTSAADNNWTSVCWSLELGLFVAVANTGTGDRVMTSPDGITWTIRTSAADNNWTSVCWAPEINSFIAIASSGTSNRIMISFDGITWTSRTSPIDNDWTSICWSSGYNMAVAVSSTGTSTDRVLTSTISLPYPKSLYITAPGTLHVNQSSGRIGLGTLSPNYQLELSTDSAAKPSTAYWSVSSDMRLKEDIEDANLDICYDNIKKLRLVKYAWKDEIINPNSINESEEQNTQLGWIANEVEEIFPKAVKTVSAYNFDDCKSLDSDQIIASLFGAAKKLLNEYEEQKNIIQSLNNELDTLQNYINQLDISLE